MITAEEARKMYLANYGIVVKHQTEQLIKIVENSINYACENGKNYAVVDTTTYSKDAIQNVKEIIKKYGYSFICGNDNFIKFLW